ncbi:NAD(P)H-hydrate dehydratase [Eggerthellaceae bacterium zg-997]|nr:NAD(P)H-hydrate dehydratase [Eggerthellaceae bacterium zg-997]
MMMEKASERIGWPDRLDCPDRPDQSDQPARSDRRMVASWLPVPARDAHKYRRGRALLVAGSRAYPGAAVLAARAAQRMGAGYVELAVPDGLGASFAVAAPSLVVHGRHDWQSRWRADGAGPAGALANDVEEPPLRAICVGPGFDAQGDADESRSLVLQALSCPVPVLVDGGGLTALCDAEGLRLVRRRFERGLDTVLTPHAGEAARLAACVGLEGSAAEAGDAPDRHALDLARAWGAVVCLKGPDTYVAAPARSQEAFPGASALPVRAMRWGGPELAKAGTGDVLAGMIAGLMAQGTSASRAAFAGACVHALAGSEAARRGSVVSVIPEDVLDALPAALNALLMS